MSNNSLQNGIRFFTGSTSNIGTTDPYTGATEKMRILPNGNVGIGTTIPDSILTVKAGGSDISLPVIKASVNGFANGYTLIGDNYTTSESQINLGISYSGANGVLSRSVRVSNTTDDVFLSSQDAYATNPNAFVLDADGSFRFLNTSTNASTPVGTAVSLSERMRINSIGNVGIGTSVPGAKLHTSNSIDGTNGTSQIRISANSSTLNYAYFGMIDQTFNTAKLKLGTTYGYGTQKDAMTIYNGDVGIGTTDPSEKLEVNGILKIAPSNTSGTQTGIILKDPGTGASEGINIQFQSASDTNTAFIGSLSYDELRIGTANIERIRIDGSGNVGIGTTDPASKLEVDGGDIEVDDSASGLILRSPDGTRYRVTVANGGTLSVAAV